MCERNFGEITAVGDPAAAAVAAATWVFSTQIEMLATSGRAATFCCARLTQNLRMELLASHR